MPAKIPKSIRERVIKQWLQGVSRDEIAKNNDIGAGTVTAIIKDAKQEIHDIDLLRAMALVRKKHDLNLPVFASLSRSFSTPGQTVHILQHIFICLSNIKIGSNSFSTLLKFSPLVI